jgi:hypothetical protein
VSRRFSGVLTERARLGSAFFVAIALPLGLVLWLRTPEAPPASPPPAASPPPVVSRPQVANPPEVAPVVPQPVRRPTVPTVELPCVSYPYDEHAAHQTDDTELRTDGRGLIVCWHNGACRDESGEVDRPAVPAPTTVATQVAPDRVCTGARCDALGPRARAAIKGVDPSELYATAGHALIVIGSDDDAQIWTRVRDRRLALPKPHKGGWDNEGDVLAVDLLGDHVLVSRRWNAEAPPPPPWAPARGTILDAQGNVTATIATDASRRGRGTSIVDLGDDQFVVFNGAGGFSLIVHGKPTWFGDLVEWRPRRAAESRAGDPALAVLEGQEQPIEAFALDAEPEAEDTALDGSPAGRQRVKMIGYKWCSSWRDDGGCHVGRIELGFHVGLHGEETQWLRRQDEHVFPGCK